MPSNFQETDSKERLVRGIGTFLNPNNLLMAGSDGSVFDENDEKGFLELPQELLFKLARSVERHHNDAVTFINGSGERDGFNF